MAKTQNKQNSKKATEETTSIVIQNIDISQMNRGNQSVQTWYNNIKSAESIRNPNRKQLYNTFLDISIDLHVRSVVDKRVRAVKTTPFEWVGLENEVFVNNFKSPWFNELLGHIMSRIFWGPTLVEFLLKDGLISDVIMIPRQNVKPEKGIISLDGNSDTGFPFREIPYKNYILEIGKPHELGLYANIAPYVLMKRQNLADFSRYNEMFGIPLRWYEYDPHDTGARENLKKAAEEMGSAAYVIVPKGTSVNFVESAKQASAFAFDKLHEILNNEITIGVLGQLLTTGGENGGSLALGQVHKQVEQGINLEDRLMVEYIVNHDFKNNILIPHGYPMDGISGYFQMTEELSMDKKSEVYLKIAEKFPIDPVFIYEEFGIPQPSTKAIELWEKYTKKASPPAPLSSSDPANPDTDPSDDDPDTDLSRKNVTKLVAQLYNAQCKHRHTPVSLQLSYTSELNNLIEQLIQDLFQKKIEPGQVDGRLRELYLKEFNVAVTKSIGNADAEFRNALLDDVKVFSQFKEYQFLRAATDALVDETGALRTFSAFRDEVLKLNSQYNIDWLQTEYNHAIGSARMAKKWQDIVKNKETLPLLQYVTAGDSRVRQSHKKLDKIILPMDHPFWDTHYPPNDWNCRCTVKQLADGEQSILRMDELPQLKPEFSTNTGKARTIFPKNHPYYNAREEDAGASANNFGLK
jgi:SPP1 gp7 family putative phage head morphogenesis protein